RVGLLGGRRVDARADPTLLGVALERGRLLLVHHTFPALTDQLVDGRHTSPCAFGISASKKRGDPLPPPRPTRVARQTEKLKGRSRPCQGAAPAFRPAACRPGDARPAESAPRDRPPAQSAGAGFCSSATGRLAGAPGNSSASRSAASSTEGGGSSTRNSMSVYRYTPVPAGIRWPMMM